jgi:hypothetical protein
VVLGGVAVLVVGATLVVRHAWAPPDKGPAQGAAYRIVYDGEQRSGGRTRVFTDVLEVHRPGLGFLLTHAGDSLNGPVVSGQVYAADGPYVVRSDAGVATAHRLHAADGLPPAVDLRLEPALTVAARLGQVSRRGTEMVAGVRCRVYLSEKPLGQGGWHLPRGGDEVRSCVSSDGHLLRDSWSVEGTVLLTHRAHSVELLPPGAFDPLAGLAVDPVIPDPVSTGAVQVPRPAASPLAVRIPAPPPHLTRTGTFAVLQYSPFRLGSVMAASERQAFSGGADSVTLTQTRMSPDESGTQPAGERVDLGAVGWGFLMPGPQGLSITVPVSATVQVVVVGSLGERELLTWLRGVALVR